MSFLKIDLEQKSVLWLLSQTLVKSVGNNSVCSVGVWLNFVSLCLSQASTTTIQDFSKEETFSFKLKQFAEFLQGVSAML